MPKTMARFGCSITIKLDQAILREICTNVIYKTSFVTAYFGHNFRKISYNSLKYLVKNNNKS